MFLFSCRITNAGRKILDVVEKTLAFHTSVSYQVQAPAPFNRDVQEDILGDVARIRKQSYNSDYDLHIDLSRSVRRLNDGHCVWVNSCYVTTLSCFSLTILTKAFSLGLFVAYSRGNSSCLTPLFLALYISFLPIPLVLLTDSKGAQSIHISPVAFSVAKAEFPDQIDVWQKALPPVLVGKLESVCPIFIVRETF
jgi:hypothetical protein